MLFSNADELFPINSMLKSLAERARQSGGLLQKVGGIALSAGLIAGAAPLAVVGATALAVGFAVGLSNSIVYDGARSWVSNESASETLIESAKYAASYVVGAASGVANNAATRLVDHLNGSGSYLSAFIVDQVYSYGVDTAATALMDGAPSFYAGASQRISTYTSSLLNLPPYRPSTPRVPCSIPNGMCAVP